MGNITDASWRLIGETGKAIYLLVFSSWHKRIALPSPRPWYKIGIVVMQTPIYNAAIRRGVDETFNNSLAESAVLWYLLGLDLDSRLKG
jgi:hypothetical protein